MATLGLIRDMSPTRLVLIATVGTILISIVRSFFKGKGAIHKGAKPLPGPKGEEFHTCQRQFHLEK